MAFQTLIAGKINGYSIPDLKYSANISAKH